LTLSIFLLRTAPKISQNIKFTTTSEKQISVFCPRPLRAALKSYQML